MIKHAPLAVVSLLLVALVSGCGDSEPSSTREPQATQKEAPQKASSEVFEGDNGDYAEIIHENISKNDGYVRIKFPYSDKEPSIMKNMCAYLATKNLLKVSDQEVYELTPELKKYYVDGQGLKFADVSLDKVVEVNELQGLVEVKFTYELDNIAPWATGIPENDSPSQLLRVLSGDKTKKKKAKLVIEGDKVKIERATVFSRFEDADKARMQYMGY